MEPISKWLGPGLIVGGLGAAMLCGAGLAGADTGADAGPGGRGAHAAASASGSGDSARKARSGPARVAPARVGAPKASASALPPPAVRVRTISPAAAVRTSDNKPPVAAKPRVVVPAAAAAVRAAAPAAAAVPAPAPAPAPAPMPAPAAAVAVAGPPPPAAATAAVPVAPSSTPVDPAQFAGTYYEQGSVKQFFSIGLVNTKAVYTAKPDGTLGVQNSGNYFFKRGPKSSITGSAVPVNDTNTALNVGFGGTPSASPPGNYVIVDRAPDYSWVIVSDPSGRSGYILTRSQTIDPQTYARLVARSRELGVTGRITPTRQFPG